MFGLVSASLEELSQQERDRYSAVYCGICRQIGRQDGQLCRLGLSYDMAFLALLQMSLYEPEEQQGSSRCVRHPVKRKPWIDSESIRYAARMNVALACFKARDDWEDEGKRSAKLMARVFGRNEETIAAESPRQCAAIADCIRELSQLEKSGCPNPDEPAGCFGRLMAELMVIREDRWADDLRQMGFSKQVLDAVALMTHDPAVPYMDYIARIKANPIARAVKLADLRHNSDLTRLDTVTPQDEERAKKYRKAIRLLKQR